MKTPLFAVVASLVLAASAALAADVDEQPPPLPPPPAIAPLPASLSWTGFYVGVNAGLRTNQNEMQVDTLPYRIGLWDDRGVGGVQAGYNWQFWPRWLIGLEADLSASDIVKVWDDTTVGAMRVGTNIDWFGTVRPRLGFAVTPRTLLYVSGGWVFAHASNSVTNMGVTSSFGTSESGWARGFGVEYAVTDWLSFKTEYFYLNLNSGTFSSPAVSFQNSSIGHMIRAGLNFKLGPPLGPSL